MVASQLTRALLHVVLNCIAMFAMDGWMDGERDEKTFKLINGLWWKDSKKNKRKEKK